MTRSRSTAAICAAPRCAADDVAPPRKAGRRTPAPPAATIALLAFASFCAGLVDSIAGGGGLITVPALFATGLPVPVALATNKGQASFVAVSSLVSFWARGEVDKRRARLGFIGGFAGSLARSCSATSPRSR